jgi:hypothetical protein
MDLGEAALFGAVGGALVSAAFTYTDLIAWQKLRLEARRAHKRPISVGHFFDPIVNILVLITRIAFGAVAGLIFHAQVTGASAAIAIGVAAPLVVAQIGRLGSVQARVAAPPKRDESGQDTESSEMNTASKATE